MLSTTPPILGITKDDGKSKLGIYKVYDFTKGGTDIIDQRMGFYTCKPKSIKWTIAVFTYVIDMARVNSCTIFALQKKYDTCKQDSFKYCYTLLYQLVKPFIQSQSLNGLTTMMGQKIELVIVKGQWEVEGEAIGPPMSENKGRCHLRISNLAGVAHKLKKNRMCRVKAFCRICKSIRVKIILLQHVKYVWLTTIRQLTSIIGSFISIFQAVLLEKMNYRQLEWKKVSFLRMKVEAKIALNQYIVTKLKVVVRYYT